MCSPFIARALLPALAWLFVLPAAIGAQEPASGILIGTLRDLRLDPAAGVAVRVFSSPLQSELTAVTDAEGRFVLRGLPRGAYRVVFELPGRPAVERTVTVGPGRTVRTAAILPAVYDERREQSPETGLATRYTAETVEALPIGRTPFDVANLAPGVSDRAPDDGQLILSGGYPYDNLYQVDGVDVGDQLYFEPDLRLPDQGLYIEEAIAETRILASAISAEHGRFSGGVVDVVTRSGGNRFSGSLRYDLNEPPWGEEVPSATLGGPVWKDRVWFFLAARDAEGSDTTVFPATGAPRPYRVGDTRLLGKVSADLGGRHAFQLTRSDFDTTDLSPAFWNSIDPRTVAESDLAAELLGVRYAGVLTPRLFAELELTTRDQTFTGGGGTSRDLRDSPFRTGLNPTERYEYYNAPYFDATDPSEWNDERLAASLSYALKEHDLELGFERFTGTRIGGNSVSSTGYLWLASYLTDVEGFPVLDEEGRLQPIFAPDGAATVELFALRGAGLDLETTSLWVNDRFRFGDHFAFNLGLRYERVTSDATTGLDPVDTHIFVPRLAAWYDPWGDGRVRFGASWGEYAGRYHENEFGRTAGIGQVDWIASVYEGPPGVGLGFDPGFDLGNYRQVSSSRPQLGNVFFDEDLSSPVTEELTFSVGLRIGATGRLDATYVDRSMRDFVEDFVTADNPQPLILWAPPGADSVVVRNSDLPRREYRALQLQGLWRPRENLRLEGHWTYQLRNHGDYEGNWPGAASLHGNYPEILGPERNFPTGRLDDFQRFKIRLWSLYDLELGRAGALGLGLLYRYDSPRVYSLVAHGVPLSDVQQARDPGYARPPADQALYFGPRGSGEFEGSHYFDLAIRYVIPVWKVEPWVKVSVLNVFDSRPELRWNTSITPDFDGPVDADGLWTSYLEGPSFGEVWDTGAKREYLVSVGVRF